MSAKDYELIAAALLDARRTAKTAEAVAGVDLAINSVGDALRHQHRGSYAWKQSRWETATGLGQEVAGK
jgi:hypothetical protein